MLGRSCSSSRRRGRSTSQSCVVQGPPCGGRDWAGKPSRFRPWGVETVMESLFPRASPRGGHPGPPHGGARIRVACTTGDCLRAGHPMSRSCVESPANVSLSGPSGQSVGHRDSVRTTINGCVHRGKQSFFPRFPEGAASLVPSLPSPSYTPTGRWSSYTYYSLPIIVYLYYSLPISLSIRGSRGSRGFRGRRVPKPQGSRGS